MKRQQTLWEVSVTTTPAFEEFVSAAVETAFGQTPSSYHDLRTGLTRVSVYSPTSPTAVLRKNLDQAVLQPIKHAGARATVRTRKLPAQDWAESWKRHFKVIEVGRALLIRPSWSKRKPRRDQPVITLDPGLSFGTGQHATTLFCLESLVRFRKAGARQSFLDAGCGSGILAIAAAKLGYAPVHGFDFDKDAVEIARENSRRNRVSAKIRVADLTKMPAQGRERYDLICANLIYDLLIAEADKLMARLRPGGSLVLAGILRTQFAQVESAYAARGLKLVRTKKLREWQSGLFTSD